MGESVLQTSLLDHRPPADYQRDIRDPNNKKAEELVLRWARKLAHWDVRDVRHRNQHGDFELTHRTKPIHYLLDAKADRYMDTSGNVAFEWELEQPDGTMKMGWGQRPEPCLIANVGTKYWTTCVIVDLKGMREYVWVWNTSTLRDFKRADGDGFSHGWLVPIMDLKRAGVLVMTVDVGGADD